MANWSDAFNIRIVVDNRGAARAGVVPREEILRKLRKMERVMRVEIL